MAALYTQIVSVVVIIVSTVPTAHRVGCEDSKYWDLFEVTGAVGTMKPKKIAAGLAQRSRPPFIYPGEYMDWPELEEHKPLTVHVGNEEKTGKQWTRPIGPSDLKSTPISKNKKPETRQDLLAWLDLTTEDEVPIAWGLIPHSQEWQNVYVEKKEYTPQEIWDDGIGICPLMGCEG